jgi:hypothetical protein
LRRIRQGLWPSLVTAAALHTFVPPGTEAMSMDKPFQTVNRRPISATAPTRVTSSAIGAIGWLWTGRRRPKQRETAALQRDWAAMARDHAAESRKARRTGGSVPPRAVSGLPTSRRSSIWEVSALERRLATGDRRPSGRRPAQDRAAAERDRSRAPADREQAVVDRAK